MASDRSPVESLGPRDVAAEGQADQASPHTAADELQLRREELDALGEASRAVTALLQIDEVLDCILEQVERVVAGDAFNVMLIEGDVARMVRWRGYADSTLREPTLQTVLTTSDYPVLAWMKRTGRPVVVADTASDPNWVVLEQREWWRSYLGAPIRVGGETVGFLSVNGAQPNQFDSASAARFQVFADYAAIAIKNARLYEQAQQEIVERTRVEDALRDTNRRLAETLARLQETQEQVVQQERLAAIGQLAGGVAHDFNNFLTTITLYTQMALQRSDVPGELKHTLQTILDETQRAGQLVQQILDFSRRSPMRTRVVDLRPSVERAARVLGRTLPESIRLRLEMSVEDCMVEADATRIQQVLMNLVVNARDAMPDGGDLRIGLSRALVGRDEQPPIAEMQPGEWIRLSVSDTGTGISPEVLPHIFEPFFTTKGQGEGAGLGLAQVYGIVTQHGGHVGVETAPGKGTTFCVYLPALETRGLPAAEMGPARVALAGAGETILLVEDQEQLRLAGQEILEALGYRVLTAANGQEALSVFLAAGGADLLITDLVMPEMGGKRLVQELGQLSPAVRAIAMTGYLTQADLDSLESSGFVEVVTKPFDAETLSQAVRRALSRGPSH